MDVTQMLADMALQLEQDRTSDEMLQRVCDTAVILLHADEAGIMVTRSRRDVETSTATGPTMVEAHQLQATFDEGPCLDAIDGKATYATGDTRNDSRWPKWGPAAAELNVLSAVGVRLATRNRSWGSLNVYSSSVDAFDDPQVRLVEILAAHASVAFAASEGRETMKAAMDSRTTIGQAQGILMATFEVDAETAFKVLKRISQHDNIKLALLAEAIAVQRDANARPHSHHDG